MKEDRKTAARMLSKPKQAERGGEDLSLSLIQFTTALHKE